MTSLLTCSIDGDAARGTQLNSLARLLARGIRVALIHGDADLIGNWYGGQNVSLELASLVRGYQSTFPATGYADIVVNNSYVGGAVRQYGNLSFSRIYDAGHQIPYYQPETAFAVFTRIIHGCDVSTGGEVDLSTFGTRGPSISGHRNVVPPEPASVCWIREAAASCTEEERAAIQRGKGMVKAGIWTPSESIAIREETSGSLSLQSSRLFGLLHHAIPLAKRDGNLRKYLIGGLASAAAFLL